MEEIVMQQILGYGVLGIIAMTLFKKLVDDSKQDKEYFRQEIKEVREESAKDRELYKEELSKDRLLFQTSMSTLVNKIESVEQDVVELKDSVKSLKN